MPPITEINSLTIRYCPIKNLGKLKKAKEIEISNLEYLANIDGLESVGKLEINSCKKLKSLGTLKTIDSLELYNTPIKSLGNLERINQDFKLGDDDQVTDFGNLKYIGGTYTPNEKTTDLSNFEYIGGLNLYRNNKIKTLGKIKELNNLYLSSSDLKSLGDLEIVKQDFEIMDCNNLLDLGKLRIVEGHFEIRDCPNLKSISSLQKCSNVNIINCEKLKDLGNFEEVDSLLISSCNGIKSFGKLKKVVKNINIRYCENLETLSQLEIVGGELDIYYSPLLKDLGKLKIVGDNLVLYNVGITSLGSLEKDLSTNQSALEIFLEHVPIWLPCNRLYNSLCKLG
jgi:hypothetical protein